jgi:polar amino acid transport system substrate-binding protein
MNSITSPFLRTGPTSDDAAVSGATALRVGKGGWQGLKVAVAKPDPRLPASIQPGQTTLPYTKSNKELGDALSADVDASNKSGEIAKILVQNRLDPKASEVGSPRLIQ